MGSLVLDLGSPLGLGAPLFLDLGPHQAPGALGIQWGPFAIDTGPLALGIDWLLIWGPYCFRRSHALKGAAMALDLGP